MPCFHPLQAFSVLGPDGKKRLSFPIRAQIAFRQGKPLVCTSGEGDYLSLPCGRCMGCRLERSRQWALRMVHEAKFFDDNCFVTLTFDDEHLAKMCPGGSLSRKHVQDFLKRLRQRFQDRKIRVFYCGEYGDKNDRPHYHLCLFNLDFDDKVKTFKSNGFWNYSSDVLSVLWPFGMSSVTGFSFDTAAYVARYVCKKITGSQAEAHYKGRLPEFCGMSLKPGIGRLWFDKYGKTDVHPTDTCMVNGVKCKPPRYYDKLRELEDPEAFAKVKELRAQRAESKADDNSYDRLMTKEKCMDARIRLLIRKLE